MLHKPRAKRNSLRVLIVFEISYGFGNFPLQHGQPSPPFGPPVLILISLKYGLKKLRIAIKLLDVFVHDEPAKYSSLETCLWGEERYLEIFRGHERS